MDEREFTNPWSTQESETVGRQTAVSRVPEPRRRYTKDGRIRLVRCVFSCGVFFIFEEKCLLWWYRFELVRILGFFFYMSNKSPFRVIQGDDIRMIYGWYTTIFICRLWTWNEIRISFWPSNITGMLLATKAGYISCRRCIKVEVKLRGRITRAVGKMLVPLNGTLAE